MQRATVCTAIVVTLFGPGIKQIALIVKSNLSLMFGSLPIISRVTISATKGDGQERTDGHLIGKFIDLKHAYLYIGTLSVRTRVEYVQRQNKC